MQHSPVEHILHEMKMLFGNLFEKQWQDADFSEMTAFWERKLAGFNRDELRRGFKALETLKYPPTLPEFMQLCRPPIDPVKAYYEAVKGVQERRSGRKGQWSHPAIFWTAASMSHDLLNLSYTSVKAAFEKRLSEELSKTSWQEIPDVSTPLPPPKVDREKAKAEAEKALRQLGASNALKPADRGNTDWVNFNLKRLSEGWKPTQAVRMMVMQAVGMAGITVPEGI